MTFTKIIHRTLATGCLVFLLGTSPIVAHPPTSSTESPSSAASATPQPSSREATPLPHWLQWTEQVFSGAQPTTADDFAALQARGIRTIVSVDGARPNVELAKHYGMRYLHVPIGYDGIDPDANLSFFRIAKEVQGTVYVHCHHGKHRGPAAAAVLCMGAGKIDRPQAEANLRSAGTSPNYTGLWKAVRDYRRPAADQELPQLVEIAQVTSTAAWMAQIDRTWDNLKACQNADWKHPKDNPDLVAKHEALQLWEGFTEAQRLLPNDAPTSLKQGLQTSQELSQSLMTALRKNESVKADRLILQLQEACVDCHKVHR
ncbi:hypothetical protein FF011L_23040 [Roseimaritima multifibrata]|uniref:Cytochrome C n=1 Tax=Roseimaritima multifibrata TaxID=1930274 RepID=A0A517MF70_9BACT|nr:hypothetical protein [Roseimaritima multifibrata]QDS93534.1 hypothetical protein FF011L_23040 [Roseimaritima multifibrata]